MSDADNDKPTISLAQAKRAATKALGPNARIWHNPDGSWSMGVDKKPGRLVLCSGPDLWFCLFGRYDPPPPPKDTAATGQASPQVVKVDPVNDGSAAPVPGDVLAPIV